MKPYPKYKDSGVEWIGEVPEGRAYASESAISKTPLPKMRPG